MCLFQWVWHKLLGNAVIKLVSKAKINDGHVRSSGMAWWNEQSILFEGCRDWLCCRRNWQGHLRMEETGKLIPNCKIEDRCWSLCWGRNLGLHVKVPWQDRAKWQLLHMEKTVVGWLVHYSMRWVIVIFWLNYDVSNWTIRWLCLYHCSCPTIKVFMSKWEVLPSVWQHITVCGQTGRVKFLTGPLVTKKLNVLDFFLVSRENCSWFLLWKMLVMCKAR